MRSGLIMVARMGGMVRELVKTVALTLLLVFIVRSSLVEANQVVSNSMAPTLRDGDYIVVNKLRYGLRLPFVDEAALCWSLPKRGDIVTFFPPEHEPNIHNNLYIKRIVALPGDRVALRNGFVILNGEKISPRPLPQGGWRERGQDGKEYSVFGEWGGDSFGPVTVPDGSVFVVGDNRGGSHDSRSFGPVPLSRIAGKAEIIYLPGSGEPSGHHRGSLL